MSSVYNLLKEVNVETLQIIDEYRHDYSQTAILTHPWRYQYRDTYPMSDLSGFHPGATGKCVVGESQFQKQAAFFIIDSKKVESIGGVEIKDKGIRTYSGVEEIDDGQIVGIQLPDITTRAIVSKIYNKLRIFLLDVGEELKCFDEIQRFFELNEDQRKVPAQAIFCKLVDDNANGETMSAYLDQLKLEQVSYKVVTIKK